MRPPRVFDPGVAFLRNVALGALGLVVVGIIFTVKPELFTGNAIGNLFGLAGTRIVGIVAIGLFGAVALALGLRIALRRPALVIDDHGLTLDATAAPLGRVAWREVSGVGSFEVMGNRFLVVVPHDLERRVAALPPLKRKLVQMNGRTFGAYFAVAERFLGAPLEEIMAEIGQRAPHLLGR